MAVVEVEVEVVVEEELELSFLEQVIMVKQKSDISIMCNILFIFFLNQYWEKESLKSYISKILQLDYRINPIYLRNIRPKFMYVKTYFSNLEG